MICDSLVYELFIKQRHAVTWGPRLSLEMNKNKIERIGKKEVNSLNENIKNMVWSAQEAGTDHVKQFNAYLHLLSLILGISIY